MHTHKSFPLSSLTTMLLYPHCSSELMGFVPLLPTNRFWHSYHVLTLRECTLTWVFHFAVVPNLVSSTALTMRMGTWEFLHTENEFSVQLHTPIRNSPFCEQLSYHWGSPCLFMVSHNFVVLWDGFFVYHCPCFLVSEFSVDPSKSMNQLCRSTFVL